MPAKEFLKNLSSRLQGRLNSLSFLKKILTVNQSQKDKRWVLNLTNRKKIPSFSQFLHIKKFLTLQEKRTILWLFVLIVAGLLSMGGETLLARRVLLPAIGGEYIEGEIGFPTAINPLFASLNSVDNDLTKLIFAGLLRYDSSLNLQPDLAESYNIDKDGKTIHFVLKKDLKWQDGEPITPEDILFTLNSIQNPETQSPLWVSFQGITFKQTDDRNFTLILPKPFAPALSLLTVGILPEHLWQDIPSKNMRFSSINLKPVGAGPFMFSSFTKDNRGNLKTYTLKANPNYQNKKPYLSNITFKFLNDKASALDALHNHQIMGLSILDKDESDKINLKSFSLHSLRLPYYSALFFNQRTNLLLKSNVLRQSLNLAVNRQDIINTVLKGEGLAVFSPILPGQVGFTQDFKTPFDAEAAQKKLDDDGWKRISREEFIDKLKKEKYNEWLSLRQATSTTPGVTAKAPKLSKEEQEKLKQDGDEFLATVAVSIAEKISPRQKYFRQKNNYSLTVKITTANQPELIASANIIKENLQDIGIQVEIEALENEQLKDAIKNRRYEILLYGILLGTDPDPYSFWDSSQINYPGLNLAGFANRQADQLLEKARENYLPQERTKLYHDFQKIIATETPAVFLYTSTYLYPLDSSVQGFNQYRIFDPSNRFDSITDWYVKTKSSYKW